MFANLNQGSIIHILNLCDTKYCVGTIDSVSYSNQFGVNAYLTLKVNINDKCKTIEGIQANTCIARTSDYIITETKDSMITQVENLLQHSKDILNNIDKYKHSVDEYECILKQLSPQYAKESDRDNAITDLYKKVGSLDTKLDSILTALNSKTQ